MQRRAVLQMMLAGIPLMGIPRLRQGDGGQAAGTAPILETAQGRWRGRFNSGIHIFKGIRYGADTSRRRFLPPVSPAPWAGVRDALEFGLIAPQPGSRPISEDCLHLQD